ncbi:hypothetical protein RJT34_20194 [Clitoria ternatea]|uniref:Histidine-containing phosphotransfer protein n=1 Tax=Clitoria ternatea TaxID=43366 RepID=A0AAN9P5I9_CLITE
MDLIQLQRKHRDHHVAMLHEGFVDEQFNIVHNLQDESSPYFFIEILTMFFGDSEKLLNNMAQALNQKPMNFKSLDELVHQYKGNCASVGAARIQNVCINFKPFCEAQNLEGCIRCFQELQQEYSLLKNKVQYLIKLQQEIQAAGASITKMK